MAKSFFGKRKNLDSGPTAPPRRTDDDAGFDWPQEEFDDDEGDMYEVPPCERQTVKVPQREEEDVYLERPPDLLPPQRQAALPPRPAKPSKPEKHAGDLFSDPQTNIAPVINRTEKPGRKMMPSPVVRSAPVPEPASNTEEDVYLDPNEEQEDSHDVYVEPTAACPPPFHALMRMHPFPNTGLVPPPITMRKPPVPRAQSNSLLPSLNELKTASSVEVRRTTFPSKPPPPTPSVKPPLPAKYSLLNPPVTNVKPAAYSGGMKETKQWVNEDKEWFAGSSNRKMAEDLLQRVNKDGAFLIRHSSAQGGRQPYTLAVFYQQKVYNIPIRFLGETQGYALGKEGKKNEEIFGTLDEMISHHKNNQLLLIDSKSQAKHTTYLTYPTSPSC